jgi:hypothetical protein
MALAVAILSGGVAGSSTLSPGGLSAGSCAFGSECPVSIGERAVVCECCRVELLGQGDKSHTAGRVGWLRGRRDRDRAGYARQGTTTWSPRRSSAGAAVSWDGPPARCSRGRPRRVGSLPRRAGWSAAVPTGGRWGLEGPVDHVSRSGFGPSDGCAGPGAAPHGATQTPSRASGARRCNAPLGCLAVELGRSVARTLHDEISPVGTRSAQHSGRAEQHHGPGCLQVGGDRVPRP